MRKLILIVSLLSACNLPDKDCSFSYVDLNKNVYFVKGCFVDSLENGEWVISDSAGKLIESGIYKDGVRIGEWRYQNIGGVDRVIHWKKYNNSRMAMWTNIPASFDIITEGEYMVKLSTSDSSRSLAAAIAIHNLSSIADADTFYRNHEREILEKGWELSYKRDKIVSNNRVYYFSHYLVQPKARDSLNIFNFYGVTSEHKLVDISISFSNNEDSEARIIFASILPNIFIDAKRLVNPYASITMMK